MFKVNWKTISFSMAGPRDFGRQKTDHSHKSSDHGVLDQFQGTYAVLTTNICPTFLVLKWGNPFTSREQKVSNISLSLIEARASFHPTLIIDQISILGLQMTSSPPKLDSRFQGQSKNHSFMGRFRFGGCEKFHWSERRILKFSWVDK